MPNVVVHAWFVGGMVCVHVVELRLLFLQTFFVFHSGEILMEEEDEVEQYRKPS